MAQRNEVTDSTRSDKGLQETTGGYNTNTMAKEDWFCKDLIRLILETLGNRVEHKTPDLDHCHFGSLVWYEEVDFDDYFVPVTNDAEAYAVIVGGYLRVIGRRKEGKYSSTKKEQHHEVFTEESIERVEKCSNFESLYDVVSALDTVSTDGTFGMADWHPQRVLEFLLDSCHSRQPGEIIDTSKCSEGFIAWRKSSSSYEYHEYSVEVCCFLRKYNLVRISLYEASLSEFYSPVFEDYSVDKIFHTKSFQELCDNITSCEIRHQQSGST